MTVQPKGPLIGKSIEDAALQHLAGWFLAEIERGAVILPAVGPGEHLQANDRLLFVGIVESVVDLQRIRSLVPATSQIQKLNEPRLQRCLIEAVVSDRCPVTGRSIRDGQFELDMMPQYLPLPEAGNVFGQRLAISFCKLATRFCLRLIAPLLNGGRTPAISFSSAASKILHLCGTKNHFLLY